MYLTILTIAAVHDSRHLAVPVWCPPVLLSLALLGADPAGDPALMTSLGLAMGWMARRGMCGSADPAAVLAHLLYAGTGAGLVALAAVTAGAGLVGRVAGSRVVPLYPVLLAAAVSTRTWTGSAA